MATHKQRLAAAREAIHYISSRSPEEMATLVPNCPGWSVYNTIVHIGRVGVAWHAMIDAAPEDPESRNRGYAAGEARGSGHPPEVLASWALDAVDALEDDVDRRCYFSMAGGEGTVGLWAWHAASELGVHRLDVEHALGETYTISDELAVDALNYTCEFFLPAMARAADANPVGIDVVATRDDTTIATTAVRTGASGDAASTTVTGAPVDLLLALWGRPHGPIDASGSNEAVELWRDLPSQVFQFGTWE